MPQCLKCMFIDYLLSPWEQLFYAEFDGQRKKRAVVKVMGI